MKKKAKGEQTKATVKVKAKSEIKFVDKIDEQAKEFNKKVTKEYNDTIKRAGSVYTANFKVIDDTIEDIKKATRKVSTNDYSANNVYIFLQNALKKILDAEK
jgi:hypothetical protein